MTIITDELLADIEAKAKAATQGHWTCELERQHYPECDDTDCIAVMHDGDGNELANFGERYDKQLWEHQSKLDAEHCCRMGPPTTLALVAAHRSALARIAEMEAQLQVSNEQAAKNEALADHATRWDGAQLSALELAARHAALEDALGRIAQERYADTEDAPDNDYHDGLRKGYDRSMQAVRSLLYVREIPGDPS